MSERNETAYRRAMGYGVRWHRERREWSIHELADRSTLHPLELARIERGDHDPSLHTLLRIADALELPLTDLLASADALTA